MKIMCLKSIDAQCNFANYLKGFAHCRRPRTCGLLVSLIWGSLGIVFGVLETSGARLGYLGGSGFPVSWLFVDFVAHLGSMLVPV